MNIRTATIEDIDELLVLIVETINSTCKEDYNQEQIKAWTSSVKNKEHWYSFINLQFSLVAELDNQIIGFGSLEDGNYIYFMYVHKAYLGQGIASQIYKQLENESKRLGHTHMTANVSKTAIPFFQNKGFNIKKENKNVINNVTIVNYHMVNSGSNV